MRRKLTTLLAILAVIGLTTTAAFAGSIHFAGRIGFSSGSLIAEGRVAGLATQAIVVTLDATATLTATCANRAGKQVPGHNEVTRHVETSSDSIAVDQNGSASFRLVALDPPPPTAQEAGCPRGFRVVSSSVDWTSARITVFDTNGVEIIHKDFTL
jgi:hypothetical protein